MHTHTHRAAALLEVLDLEAVDEVDELLLVVSGRAPTAARAVSVPI